MKQTLLILPFLAAASVPAAAQEVAAPTPTPAPTATPTPSDEKETVIVVTDRRNPRPLNTSPSSVTVITPEQIEAKKPLDLLDLIRRVPGISVAQSGSFGKSTSIFTRGTNSNHTLVLIDGIRANNPDDGRFDFGQVPVENVERIEIVRGPASALYGSDAIGGVINIITKRGGGEFKTGGQTEYGINATNREVLNGGGEFGKDRVSYSLFRRDSNGLFDNDDYRDNGLSLRFDRELSAKQNLTFTTRYSEAKFGVPGERDLAYDPFQRDNTRDFTTSLNWTNQVGKRRDQITFGIYDRHLSDDDRRDPDFPAPGISKFDNQVRTLEAQTSYDLGKNIVTGGVEDRHESANYLSSSSFGDATYDRSTNTRALFLQNEYKNGKLTLVPGVRFEDNSQYDSFTSYRVAAGYKVASRTLLKSSYGTAFKAPTFSQLYYPNFSNPDLKPERSRGYEAGIEQQLKNGGFVGVTAFRNRIRDLIQSDPRTFLPVNIASAKTQGVEFTLETPVSRSVRLIANSTWTQARGENAPMLRRPRLVANADLIANRGRWSYDLGVLAVGKRFDSNFVNEFSPVLYDSYQRVDFTLGYTLKSGIEVYARAANLFDQDYQEVAGFRSPGFNVVLGVKAVKF